MSVSGVMIFDTALGWCGFAWTADGLARVRLPMADRAAALGGLSRRYPGTSSENPPAAILAAAQAVRDLFAGRGGTMAEVPLDLAGVSEFHQRVYAVARAIPPGETLTYGEIAHRVGAPGAAREVGQAMGKNPCPIVVPCHRVLAAGGKIGGFSAPGGVTTKRHLLALEFELYAPAPLFAVRP